METRSIDSSQWSEFFRLDISLNPLIQLSVQTMILYLLLYSMLTYGGLKIFRWILKRQWGSVDKQNEISAKRKIVLVTGASSGIGKAAAFEFASRDATVILACRNLDKAKEAVRWIRHKTVLGELVCMELNLASLRSVKKFCDQFKSKYHQLDILVNNAGLTLQPGQCGKTEDGFEIHFGVNHLGHFLLTNLLLDLLKKAVPSRIVIISSVSHNMGKLDFNDLMSEKLELKPALIFHQLYCNSKLANALFNLELSKRLQGTGVNTYALCPGSVASEITQNFKGLIGWLIILLSPLTDFFMKTIKEGSSTTIYCALNKNLSIETGKMYRDCSSWEAKDRIALKPEDAKQLWIESEKLVNAYL